ncbi:MAG: DinB family protein [Nevskiales bacterium]
MKRALPGILFTVAVLLLALPLGAQDPTPSPGAAKELLAAWNREGGKLTAMAEDFPEDKYDFKPTPEVRSFGEHLLHVAEFIRRINAAAKGEAPAKEELTREKYKTRAEVAAVVKQAFADGAAVIEATPTDALGKEVKSPFGNRKVTLQGLWTGALVAAGEHYGSLVVYYRLSGIVPPASRR